MEESPKNATEAPNPRLIYSSAVKTVLKLKEQEEEEEKKGTTPDTCVTKKDLSVVNI